MNTNNIFYTAATIDSIDFGGFILGRNKSLADKDISHAIIYTWEDGHISNETQDKFSAISLCLINKPEFGLVKISGTGIYSVESESGLICGNIFRDAKPESKRNIYGDLALVRSIDGYAYAVGFDGTAFRMDGLGHWTWIGDDIPSSFDINSIDGFSADNIFACGMNGELWKFNGIHWTKISSPTNTHLNSIKCAPDGFVYAVGYDGIVIQGKDDSWDIINHEGPKDDIWSIECFNEQIFLSTLSDVLILNKHELEPVDFGAARPATTHLLAACTDCIWSVGDHDIASFDGKKWSRIV